MKSLLFCILLTLSFQTFAKELKIAEISSEFDEDITDFYLELDDENEIRGIRYITTMPDGGIFKDNAATAEQLLENGEVLVESNGHIVVKLEVENFSVKTGGTIILNYLYNGATRRRHIKRLSLEIADGCFTLFDNTEKINRLFLVANWVRFLGVVGVRQIQSSYIPKI